MERRLCWILHRMTLIMTKVLECGERRCGNLHTKGTTSPHSGPSSIPILEFESERIQNESGSSGGETESWGREIQLSIIAIVSWETSFGANWDWKWPQNESPSHFTSKESVAHESGLFRFDSNWDLSPEAEGKGLFCIPLTFLMRRKNQNFSLGKTKKNPYFQIWIWLMSSGGFLPLITLLHFSSFRRTGERKTMRKMCLRLRQFEWVGFPQWFGVGWVGGLGGAWV